MRTIRIFIMPLFMLSALHSFSQIVFNDSEQNLGSSCSWYCKTADVDNDNDLDIMVMNERWQRTQKNNLWINNGMGQFSLSDQTFSSAHFAFADFNGDGYSDLIIGGAIMRNDSTGNFEAFGNSLGENGIGQYATGDIDGDDDVDLIVIKQNQTGYIWTNDGTGTFTISENTLEGMGINIPYLADFNNDSYLDLLIICSNHSITSNGNPNLIFLNDGNGEFTNSGQYLGNFCTVDAAIADINNDNFPDIVTANYHSEVGGITEQEDIVYINKGNGTFEVKDQNFNQEISNGVELADLNNDGNPDVYFFHANGSISPRTDKIWLNDGSGQFTQSEVLIKSLTSGSGIIADLDNDGDNDVFIPVIDYNSYGGANRVIINNSFIPRWLQDIPGIEPELFSSEIISIDNKNTHALNFHPEGRALVFSRFPEGKSYIMYFEDSAWTNPVAVPFDGKELCFSYDGKYIYYYHIDEIYKYPFPFSDTAQTEKLSASVNTGETEYYPYITKNNSLYFSRNSNWGEGKIFYSKYENGEFQQAVEVDVKINTGGASHAYISPNEDCMLFNSPRDGSYTDNDIWLSFKNEAGDWSVPINAGETINSGADAILCPTVSPDGRFLFFTKLTNSTGKIYWVSTEFMDTLREQSGYTIINMNFESGLKIFPNPATDYIRITHKNLDNNIKYELININGRTLKSGQTNFDIINLSELQPGCYFLKCDLNKEYLVSKIIKQ